MNEYLGIYDIPYIDCYYYKIMAKDWDDAFDKFLMRLLLDNSISQEEYDEYMVSGCSEKCMKIIPLFDIEVI